MLKLKNAGLGKSTISTKPFWLYTNANKIEVLISVGGLLEFSLKIQVCLTSRP